MPIFRGSGGSTSTTDQATIDQVAEDAATATTKAAEAASSASSASSSASSASSSATSASSSASTATTKASEASTSATNAANSASAASSSATSAASSATSASGSATNAASEAAAALSSKALALDAQTAAETAESNASDHADDAVKAAYGAEDALQTLSDSSQIYSARHYAAKVEQFDSNASDSADAAAASASSASTSATNAASSETNAAASASAAAATFDLFDDAYLGAKASDPSVDNDGDALADGALYFDTTNDVMKVYDLGSTTWYQLTPTLANQANINAVVSNESNINQVASDTAVINAASANATSAAASATAAASSATDAATSAAQANAVVQGEAAVRHSIRPSLLLDFANSKTLDPRIDFTRSSTATYYDGKTFAKAEENLLTYSQEFDNAAWEKTATTVTANSTTAPDGTTTADQLIEGTANSSHLIKQQISLPTGTSDTLSVYVKSNGRRYIAITNHAVNVTTPGVVFDLQDGLVVSTISGLTGTIQAAANGFYRCTVTGTATSSNSNRFIFKLMFDSTTQTYTGDGTSGVYIWGAQIEDRSSVTAYTPTTSQPITNYIPVLQTAASGAARFDHDPVTGESKGLLIEEQRTNLLTYSEDFSNAAWSKIRSSIDSNVIVAPDGTLTGDKLVEDTTATNNHNTGQYTSSTSASSAVSATIYLKAAERTFAQIRLQDNAANINGGINFFDVAVNLTDGTTGTTYSYGSPLNTAYSVTDVGNGWYRVWMTLTKKGDSTRTDLNVYTKVSANANANPVYTGDGYSGIYIWGAQLEAGAFPTSYIPTSGSQVTRSKDAASMTGTNFSDWYRQDEGTVYGEMMADFDNTGTGSSVALCEFYQNDSNRITIASSGSSNTMQTDVFTGGSNRRTTLSSQTPNEFSKYSFGWEFDGQSASKDGEAIVEGGTDKALPTPTTLRIGLIAYGGTAPRSFIKKLAYYPTRLTNAEIVALTEA
jgi:hypothetical protein